MKVKFVLSLVLFLSLSCAVFSPSVDSIQNSTPADKQEIDPTKIQGGQALPTEFNNNQPGDQFTTPVLPGEMGNGSSTPKIVWSMPFSMNFLVWEGRFYTFTPEGNIEVVDLITGDKVWSKQVNTTLAKASVLMLDDEYLYFKHAPSRVDAYKKNDGELAWMGLIEGKDLDVSPNVGSDMDYVYVLLLDRARNNYMAKIDKKTGKVLEIMSLGPTPVGGSKTVYCPENTTVSETEDGIKLVNNAHPDGKIFQDREVVACGEQQAKSQWMQLQNFEEKPYHYLVDPGSKNIYIGEKYSSSYLLEAIEATKGEVIWTGLEVNPGANKTKWLGELNGKVIYCRRDFSLTQAYSVEDHQLIWENGETILGKLVGSYENSIIAIEGDADLIFDKEINLVSLDSETGEINWRIPIGRDHLHISVTNPWIVMNKASDDKVIFINPKTGENQATLNFGAAGAGIVYQYREFGDFDLLVIQRLPSSMNNDLTTGTFYVIDPGNLE